MTNRSGAEREIRRVALFPNPYRGALLAVAVVLAGGGIVALFTGYSQDQTALGNGVATGVLGLVVPLWSGAVVALLLWLATAAIIRSLEQGYRLDALDMAD